MVQQDLAWKSNGFNFFSVNVDSSGLDVLAVSKALYSWFDDCSRFSLFRRDSSSKSFSHFYSLSFHTTAADSRGFLQLCMHVCKSVQKVHPFLHISGGRTERL